MPLESKLTVHHLFTLARVRTAKLGAPDVGERQQIEGTFSEGMLVITNRKKICEDFANWPSEVESILKFTRKYGPLDVDAKPGGFFRFTQLDWWVCQQNFRSLWKSMMPGVNFSAADLAEGETPFCCHSDRGVTLYLSPRGTSIQLDKLWPLIELCFRSLPHERLRFCPAEFCPNPYFVATHLRQNYCGLEQCIRWGDLKAKRDYWNRNKERFSAAREGSVKGEQRHGTRKTR
jgi:hypothetical protein